MCSRSLSLAALIVAIVGAACSRSMSSDAASGVAESGPRPNPPSTRTLRVCADPNNLPFSNQREEGFENRLAQLIARDPQARVEYTWWAQRRGFARETVSSGLCDVVAGVPSGFERTLVTAPYYRSSYVFVTRRDHGLRLRTLDDPRLQSLRIGVQLI